MDEGCLDLDNRSHGTNRELLNRRPPMIAGSICEATNCTGLVLIVLAALAALVLGTIVIVLAWAATVASVLERRGWGPANRRTAAAFVAAGGIAMLWGGQTTSSDFGSAVVGLVVVLAVPVALWQRSVTKRYRAGQSSPCSTA